jgi:hypothetical protein
MNDSRREPAERGPNQRGEACGSRGLLPRRPRPANRRREAMAAACSVQGDDGGARVFAAMMLHDEIGMMTSDGCAA